MDYYLTLTIIKIAGIFAVFASPALIMELLQHREKEKNKKKFLNQA